MNENLNRAHFMNFIVVIWLNAMCNIFWYLLRIYSITSKIVSSYENRNSVLNSNEYLKLIEKGKKERKINNLIFTCSSSLRDASTSPMSAMHSCSDKIHKKIGKTFIQCHLIIFLLIGREMSLIWMEINQQLNLNSVPMLNFSIENYVGCLFVTLGSIFITSLVR